MSHTPSPNPLPSMQSPPQPQPQPQPQPPSPSPSPSASRSPVSGRKTIKRNNTFSPVPEEPASTSNTTPDPSSQSGSPHKKPRLSALDPERRRGQRLLGVLTSTLTAFKRESESTAATTTAANRAQISARLASKLHHSSTQISTHDRKRTLLWKARSLAEQIATGDAQRATLRKLKRRMASFLFTTHSAHTTNLNRSSLAHAIPCSIQPPNHRSLECAVYFLPGKTLPAQEDRLNEQEDSVDDQIDAFDDVWEAHRAELVRKLDAVKAQVCLV